MPPVMQSDEIAAMSGGMYYGQEAPGMPRFLEKGAHFNKGDALYIIEVMKMFNKVLAPFSGTVDEVIIDTDGTIVQKGQTLFKVTPDEKVVVEDPALREARIRKNTDQYVAVIAGCVFSAGGVGLPGECGASFAVNRRRVAQAARRSCSCTHPASPHCAP